MATAILYTKTTCPHCTQVKTYLNAKGVTYEERNIEQSDDFAQQVWDMGLRAVPVTVIGDAKIVGMNKLQLEKALNA